MKCVADTSQIPLEVIQGILTHSVGHGLYISSRQNCTVHQRCFTGWSMHNVVNPSHYTTNKQADWASPSRGWVIFSPSPYTKLWWLRQLTNVTDNISSVQLSDKELKHLDLLGDKSYSLASLQFRIATYQYLLAKYEFTNYSKFAFFIEHLTQDWGEQFQAPITEGQTVSKASL